MPIVQKTAAPNLLTKWAMILLGAFIVLAGLVIAPLPGPFGVPIMVVGLVLILRSSYRAKRGFMRAVRRYPKVLYPIRRLLRRKPEVAPVFWQQFLRLERLFLRKDRRGATRARRWARDQWARRATAG